MDSTIQPSIALPLSEAQLDTRRKTLRSIGIAIFVTLWLIPPILIAGFIWRYGVDEPWMDDFATGENYHTALVQGLNWPLLISRHNESRPLFPRLLWQVLNTQSRWDVRYQMGASFVIILCTGLLLICVCRRTIINPVMACAASLLVNFLLFSPVQWQNLFWGIQTIVFIPALSLVIILLSLGSRLKLWISMPVAAAAAVVSTYSNSNGMLVLILAVPLIFIHQSIRRRLGMWLWIGFSILVVGYYFHNYSRPEYHPPMSLAFRNPVQAVQFLLAFLGNGVRQSIDFDADVSLGIVVALVWALGVLYTSVIRRGDLDLRRKAMPWILLGAYSVLSAGTATLGRFGFGPDAAIVDRYCTFAIPLWFSIVPLWIVIFQCTTTRRTAVEKTAMLISAGGGIVVALAMLKGCLYIRSELLASNAARLADRSAAQFALVAPDDDALTELYRPDDVATPKRVIACMDRLDLFHPQCFRSNDISTIAASDKNTTIGSFDVMTPTGDWLMLAGWAYIPPRMTPADAVLLTTPDAKGVERVFAIVTENRDARTDVAAAMHCRELDRSGWKRLLKKDRLPHGAVVSAWAFDTYSRRAYRLNKTHTIP
jgi:hypothetical protein